MPIDRPSGGDRPHETDRPHERREFWESSHHHRRDYRVEPLTADEIETNRKVSRGEVRWDGSGWVESEPFDHVKRRDRADRMRDEVDLGEKARELPNARDVLPNLNWAEIDARKFSEYSLNPDNPKNRGKADGWRAVGYDVDDPEARRDEARDLKDLVYHELLPDGKVAAARESDDGTFYRVLNGFIGPNGRHGTLVTGWLMEDPGERGYPRMTTTWMQPHKDKEIRG